VLAFFFPPCRTEQDKDAKTGESRLALGKKVTAIVDAKDRSRYARLEQLCSLNRARGYRGVENERDNRTSRAARRLRASTKLAFGNVRGRERARSPSSE